LVTFFLKQLDETIALHENKLETYQELKKAMLQKDVRFKRLKKWGEVNGYHFNF